MHVSILCNTVLMKGCYALPAGNRHQVKPVDKKPPQHVRGAEQSWCL